MGSKANGYEDHFQEQYPRVVAMLILFHGFAPQIAEDAAAEAMTRLFPRWEKVCTPKAWVRTVALRVARQIAQEQHHALPDWELTDGKAADDLAAVELALTVGSAIPALPPRQQEAIRLALVDMTPAEIADALGCTAEQARGNLAHARRTLQKALGTEEEA
ncbi:RNA polymerase sigma factor [Streptomyces sp. NPDC057298]|uniref:RNA polymerase sigma factor n=1 Tax=Streptomyces sp. NPDC057298 TaxID=3346091 RepID=UPI003639B7D0